MRPEQSCGGGVSVVIPHRDRPRLLALAIDSVLAQGDTVEEVIVVDDGSTEKLPEALLRHYGATGKVEFLFIPQNRGAPHARNLGIARARQSYIALLDCDDEWLPGKLERQLKHLIEHQLDISATRFNRVGPNDVERDVRWPRFRGDPARFILSEGGHMQTSTLLLRTEAARAVLFDEALAKYQDWDFVIRAHALGLRLGFLDEALTLYRFGHGLPQMKTMPADPLLAERFVKDRRGIIGPSVAHGFMVRHVTKLHLQAGDRRGALLCAWRAVVDYRRLAPRQLLRFLRRLRRG